MDEDLSHYARLDGELVTWVKDLKILSTLSWPKRAQERFLDDWRRGNARPPEISYRRYDHTDRLKALAAIARQCDDAHPIGRYLQRTALSWQTAARMLEKLGTAALTRESIQLYGRPGDRIAGSAIDNLEAARHFIQAAAELMGSDAPAEIEYCLSADTMKAEIEARLQQVFVHHHVKVEIDPDLVAKAAAGPTRIRLRASTCYSEYDLSQLLEHEAFVHSLTSLNGRAQRNLPSLALNSPRITATQEGLAVFAELVTGSIDIMRMKRISLRILAIDMALHGADFIQVFKFFLDQGQTESDSFLSAMRVFRGVPTTGGAAFTKDTVYLHGLLAVHTFFRWALRSNKLGLAQHLFAGKMTLTDVSDLEPYFAQGFIDPPVYLPPWMRRSNGLAGYLAFSLFVNRIRLDQLDREHVLLGI